MKKQNIIHSFNNAIRGIFYAFKTQRNIKIHFIALVFIILFVIFSNLNPLEIIILIILVSNVFVAELINTSIEYVINMITEEYHPIAKIAKDIAAAGVLVSAFASLLAFYFLLINSKKHYYELSETVLEKINKTSGYIIFIALITIILIIFLLKLLTGKGSPLSGGWPSGHSAISFAVTTAVMLSTKSLYLTFLVLILAIIISYSRVKEKIHNIEEVITGAMIGIFVTIFIFKLFGKFL